MSKKYFSFILAVLLFSTTSGGAALAVEKPGGKISEAEKIRQKVLKRGTGVKARARVRLADGTKLKGYITAAAADDFTLVRTDEPAGAAVRINYHDVAEFKAQGKGMSRTSKVLLGTGIAAGVTVVALVLAFRNFRFDMHR